MEDRKPNYRYQAFKRDFERSSATHNMDYNRRHSNQAHYNIWDERRNKYLKALPEKEPHEMICEILRPKALINNVLNRKELQTDCLMLIMETVRKLCESDFKNNRAQVLQHFCQSTSLLDHISHYLGDVAIEKSTNTIENLNSFVSNLVVFYSAIIRTIPTVAVDRNLDKLLTKTKIGMEQMKTYLNTEIDQKVREELVNLEKIFQDETNFREEKIGSSSRIKLLDNLPPPDDFRELSLYPTEEDLNQPNFGFVRPNKIKGAYENVEHYLDVQFRLIREDFVDPLRRGLRNYKDTISVHGKPKYKYESIRLYPNTRIEGIEVTKDNRLAYVVNFNLNGRLKIKWEHSKRFMFGSLLLFSRDNLGTFFFGTVFNRDLEWLKRGRILVALVGKEPLSAEMLNKPVIMAESEVYFEPYFLVMKALKDYKESDFPMKKFIVEGNTTSELPDYIINVENIGIYGHSVNVIGNGNWPNPAAIGFDPHQFNAFKTALTSKFTVIQGPPGTGKTYLGLKIVEVLLKNIEMNRHFFQPPILLVCYTNHALDQFLEGILKFTKKIVRVGGQSKSDLLKEYNLRGKESLFRLRRETKGMFPAMQRCRGEIKDLLNQFTENTKWKKLIENAQGILPYHVLSELIDPEFKQIIRDDESLLLWLLDTEAKNNSPIVPNKPKKTVEENVIAHPTESIEIDEKIYIEEGDEWMEANVIINEDDEFQHCMISKKYVSYCLSKDDLRNYYHETQEYLFDLERKHKTENDMKHHRRNGMRFQDYTEYNLKYELKAKLRIIDLQNRILHHYLENADPDTFTNNNVHYSNIWNMPLDLRWSIYSTWISQLKQTVEVKLQNLEIEVRSKSLQYEEFKQLEDFHGVKNSLVVGMTTTGAARLQLLLKILKPAIVIVEEAAEVLEAHIVVSLTKNCKHVILIGDHKQLKPSAAVYELSKKYNINVSLFERMVNNNMYCPQLQIQHRMRPEISSLIVPSIYPDLKNHESVFKYPSVEGITKNVFFVEHTVYEEDVEDSSSRKNKFEAEFMIQLCRYLLLQGYEEEQITILTTYTGQMYLLREMKLDFAIMSNVKVIVVDKYQGEENDIILLSLVRSNKERKIGFLNIENRVCVALSRAKIGLYIIGNMDMLSDCSLWRNIKGELVKQEAIGPKLPLYCDTHDVYTEVSCKSDFNNVLTGGCKNYCHRIMNCGHRCELLCHKLDLEHLKQKCYEKCLKQCVENHPCKNLCYQECEQCAIPMKRTLPCGHEITLPCFIDYQKYLCQEELTVILEHCSHEVKKRCYQSMDSVKCTFPCEDRLECGHQCVKKCHKTEDPEHLEYKCRKVCDKNYPGCSRQHNCKKCCFEDCGKCENNVDFVLKCGHSAVLKCSDDPDEFKCPERCEKKCLECNATCSRKCYEECKPCKNKVKKTIPDCGHERKLECSVVPERELCLEKCERDAACGHKCKSRCSKECDTERCLEVVKSSCVQALCGHGYANVPCWRREEEIDAEERLEFCTEPCNAILKCGDPCTGTCGSCWQGRFHQTCEQNCKNILVCGHSCMFPCRNICPPCFEMCQYSCQHLKCPNDCGVPCLYCEEKCEWKCAHFKCQKRCGDMCNRPPCYEPCREKLKCKHYCIGFCGEPCPPKCRICDGDEVKTIRFGDEDRDDARFVLLVDCGHFIESKAMDKFINTPLERGEIVLKVCPLCETPISKTLRYKNQVKKYYRDIQNVKNKIYGNERDRWQIRQEVIRKLKNLNLGDHQLLRGDLRLIREVVIMYRGMLINDARSSYISKQALRAMHFFAIMFLSITSRSCVMKKWSVEKCARLYEILELLLRHANLKALLINAQQVEEAQRELNRYHRIVDYIMYLNEPKYRQHQESPNVVGINAEIVVILYGIKCFDNEQDARIGQLFRKLHEEVKAPKPVSWDEKGMMTRAEMEKDFIGEVNSQAGHWFTCINGHYYYDTRFGGAMLERKCPQCIRTRRNY